MTSSLTWAKKWPKYFCHYLYGFSNAVFRFVLRCAGVETGEEPRLGVVHPPPPPKESRSWEIQRPSRARVNIWLGILPASVCAAPLRQVYRQGVSSATPSDISNFESRQQPRMYWRRKPQVSQSTTTTQTHRSYTSKHGNTGLYYAVNWEVCNNTGWEHS